MELKKNAHDLASKESNESEQADIDVSEDGSSQTDNFVSEWAFHSNDDTAEFFPQA